MTIVRVILLFCFSAFMTQGWAHSGFGNRLQISPGNAFWTLQWSAPVDELNLALGLDRDGNQLIHWWEIEAKRSQITDYARDHFTCEPRLSCGSLQPIGEVQIVTSQQARDVRLLMHFRLPIYGEINALHVDWLLAQNPYRPLVLQWFRRGAWQDESIHLGSVIELDVAP